MKRRREPEIEPRRSRRLNPFPFLDLLRDMRGEVYARLDVPELLCLTQTNHQMHEETRSLVPVLPEEWRFAWEHSELRHREATRFALLDLIRNGIPTWKRVFDCGHPEPRRYGLRMIWCSRQHPYDSRWILYWKYAARGWLLFKDWSRFNEEEAMPTFLAIPAEKRDELRAYVEAPDRDTIIHTPW
jgi:hypothetical protein